MKHDSVSPRKRRAVNLSLDADIVDAAKAAGINLSRITEAALRAATKAEMERRWKEENRAAFDYWNAWVAENGLPLAKYRMF